MCNLTKKLQGEEDKCVYYYIDTSMLGHVTLQYSFNQEEREDVQEKLKEQALSNLVQKVEYPKEKNGLDWIDYKRQCIGNWFKLKKEAEEKAQQIIKFLNNNI